MYFTLYTFNEERQTDEVPSAPCAINAMRFRISGDRRCEQSHAGRCSEVSRVEAGTTGSRRARTELGSCQASGQP